jgi:hypothetical protein
MLAIPKAGGPLEREDRKDLEGSTGKIVHSTVPSSLLLFATKIEFKTICSFLLTHVYTMFAKCPINEKSIFHSLLVFFSK